jgi:hypothetical protein
VLVVGLWHFPKTPRLIFKAVFNTGYLWIESILSACICVSVCGSNVLEGSLHECFLGFSLESLLFIKSFCLLRYIHFPPLFLYEIPGLFYYKQRAPVSVTVWFWPTWTCKVPVWQ